MSEEIVWAGAARLAERLRAREVSAREVLDVHLGRIARLDPRVNAFRTVLVDEARRAAGAAQVRLDAGETAPLLGVPVALKDNVEQAGQISTLGTAGWRSAPATRSAELVLRLERSGAVIVGRTHLPELAILPITESVTWGATRNPWNLARTPGGSSGGSGAAVAAGLVPLAHATDGGGSIRIPASCCGLVGLKPGRGQVPLGPAEEHWHGLSSAGCVSRSVEDTALFLDVVSDRHGHLEAARRDPGRLRIALSTKPVQPGPVSREVVRAVHDLARTLRELGHEVGEEDPDYGVQLPAFLPRYLRGISDEAATLDRPRLLERRTRGFVRLGHLISDRGLARARAREDAFARRLGALWERWDVLLTPTLARPPERIGWLKGRGAVRTLDALGRYVPFTPPWNLVGWPAMSVPAALSSQRTPIGAQLVAPEGGEGTLLALGAQLEAVRRWTDHHPQSS